MVKSHGDDLGPEYLWNGDEYGFLKNSLRTMEKNAEYGGQPEILAPVHVIERQITVHYEGSDKGTLFGKFFTDRPGIDILYYPEERDDKGELIKAGHYVLLRRATLLSQPENENVHSLGHYVAVCSETNDWYMCVISEINDPSKVVKVRFMRKSGQYFLLSKKLEKWFPNPAIFHRCSIPSSIDDRMRSFFDAGLQDGPSYLQITAQMNVTKRKLLILIKNSIACSCVSHKLLMYPTEDNCCKR